MFRCSTRYWHVKWIQFPELEHAERHDVGAVASCGVTWPAPATRTTLTPHKRKHVNTFSGVAARSDVQMQGQWFTELVLHRAFPTDTADMYLDDRRTSIGLFLHFRKRKKYRYPSVTFAKSVRNNSKNSGLIFMKYYTGKFYYNFLIRTNFD
jgi:hypothetical protein